MADGNVSCTIHLFSAMHDISCGVQIFILKNMNHRVKILTKNSLVNGRVNTHTLVYLHTNTISIYILTISTMNIRIYCQFILLIKMPTTKSHNHVNSLLLYIQVQKSGISLSFYSYSCSRNCSTKFSIAHSLQRKDNHSL